MPYYTNERKEAALEDLATIHECAKKAGIEHALFIGFGLLLGIVRERDFIGHDSDVDMCVLADRITADQELAYFTYLKQKSMFHKREKWSFRTNSDGFMKSGVVPGPVQDAVRFTWFSLRKRTDHGKFCHWFMFPWNGYLWHTKAGLWVRRRKFDPAVIDYKMNDAAIMKGIPQEYINELVPYNFHGIEVQIPKRAGTCLDFWYDVGHWLVPRKGGTSSKKVTCVVGDWNDQKTWHIKM